MMRAAVADRYGPPDVLRIVEVDTPVPAADEVLVRIHAAAVTMSAIFIRSGRVTPDPLRPVSPYDRHHPPARADTGLRLRRRG
jgi:NADPH:quinone reductase-like Zn-dependent oxidoreductase